MNIYILVVKGVCKDANWKYNDGKYHKKEYCNFIKGKYTVLRNGH